MKNQPANSHYSSNLKQFIELIPKMSCVVFLFLGIIVCYVQAQTTDHPHGPWAESHSTYAKAQPHGPWAQTQTAAYINGPWGWTQTSDQPHGPWRRTQTPDHPRGPWGQTHTTDQPLQAGKRENSGKLSEAKLKLLNNICSMVDDLDTKKNPMKEIESKDRADSGVQASRILLQYYCNSMHQYAKRTAPKQDPKSGRRPLTRHGNTKNFKINW